MPPRKNKQANQEKLKVGWQAKLEKETVAESDTALNNLQSSFRESKAYTTQLTTAYRTSPNLYRPQKQT